MQIKIQDLEIRTYTNFVDNPKVTVIHSPTGWETSCKEFKSQKKNREKAISELMNFFNVCGDVL